MNGSGGTANEGRSWEFGWCAYVEISRQLYVHGKPVRIEAKPADVLVQLLERPGVTLSKDELIGHAWDTATSDQSLTTAIRKLRLAFGGGRDEIILNVSGIGYRLAIPVTESTVLNPAVPAFRLAPGDAIPGRPHWKAVRPLGIRQPECVWLTEHCKTHEVRVFKFATDGVRLRALQREVTLSRLLQKSLPDSSGFIRVVDWELEHVPFFVESEYVGSDLLEWASTEEFQLLPVADRVALVAGLAETLASAHALGILHNDLKPTNILVLCGSREGAAPQDRWQIRIADFGVASLSGVERLRSLEITEHGFPGEDANRRTGDMPVGTEMYRAPELLHGAAPSVLGDVYALGVMLYQVVCGDFLEPPAAGWEGRIADPLLREDIAAAANRDPAARITSASALAERLRTLHERRAEQDSRAAALASAQRAEQALAEARLRRPWVVLAMAALCTGLLACLGFAHRAAHQRDIAESINGFLADDLLTRANPFRSGKAEESILDAIEQASPNIDRRFASEPLVAAHLHQTIARALDNRIDYQAADEEYAAAAALYIRAEGPLSTDAVICQMQRAAMDTRMNTAGSLNQARTLYAQEQPVLARLKSKSGELPVWVDFAHGLIQVTSDDAQDAVVTLKHGLEAAKTLPAFHEDVILTIEHALMYSEIRLGDGADAERLIREMMATVIRTHYTGKPNLLNLHANLAQAYMAEQKNRDAIREVDLTYPALVQQMGAASPLSETMLGVRAQAEASLGLWDDAARDSLLVHQFDSPESVFLEAGSLMDASLYECRGGHLAKGEMDAREAIALGKGLAATRPDMRSSLNFSLATCLVGRKSFNEAERLLSTINVAAVAQMNADADWSADVELTWAEIDCSLRNYTAAGKQLDLAKAACLKAGAAPYRSAWFHRLASRMPARTG